ncbi:hypothetical protein L1887_54815 [Cichorium endivia]|nr:hypothetical protein L1887_54815 [Cichorium endivia]
MAMPPSENSVAARRIQGQDNNAATRGRQRSLRHGPVADSSRLTCSRRRASKVPRGARLSECRDLTLDCSRPPTRPRVTQIAQRAQPSSRAATPLECSVRARVEALPWSVGTQCKREREREREGERGASNCLPCTPSFLRPFGLTDDSRLGLGNARPRTCSELHLRSNRGEFLLFSLFFSGSNPVPNCDFLDPFLPLAWHVGTALHCTALHACTCQLFVPLARLRRPRLWTAKLALECICCVFAPALDPRSTRHLTFVACSTSVGLFCLCLLAASPGLGLPLHERTDIAKTEGWRCIRIPSSCGDANPNRLPEQRSSETGGGGCVTKRPERDQLCRRVRPGQPGPVTAPRVAAEASKLSRNDKGSTDRASTPSLSVHAGVRMCLGVQHPMPPRPCRVVLCIPSRSLTTSSSSPPSSPLAPQTRKPGSGPFMASVPRPWPLSLLLARCLPGWLARWLAGWLPPLPLWPLLQSPLLPRRHSSFAAPTLAFKLGCSSASSSPFLGIHATSLGSLPPSLGPGARHPHPHPPQHSCRALLAALRRIGALVFRPCCSNAIPISLSARQPPCVCFAPASSLQALGVSECMCACVGVDVTVPRASWPPCARASTFPALGSSLVARRWSCLHGCRPGYF